MRHIKYTALGDRYKLFAVEWPTHQYVLYIPNSCRSSSSDAQLVTSFSDFKCDRFQVHVFCFVFK